MTGDAQGRFIDWYADASVVVVDLALACCAIETEFAVPAGAPRLAVVPDGARVVAVVSGTLTDALAGLVKEEIDNLPDPFVVSFGACACAGGPYWDAPSVTKGVGQLVRVDSWIAGCPPPPDALTAVLDQVRATVAVAS